MFNEKEENVNPFRIGENGYEAVISRSIYNGCRPISDTRIYFGIYVFNGRDDNGNKYYNQSLHFNLGENLGISLRDNPFNSNDESQGKHFIITQKNVLYDCFAALLVRKNPFTLVDNTNTGLAKEVVIARQGDKIELSFINKRLEFTSLNKFAVVNESYKQETDSAIRDFFISCFECLKMAQAQQEERLQKQAIVKKLKFPNYHSLSKVPQ